MRWREGHDQPDRLVGEILRRGQSRIEQRQSDQRLS
jgi:hypothetical protein